MLKAPSQPNAIRRPNTAVDDALLHQNLLLCCGEDPTELLLSLPEVVERPLFYHEYRCYRFWRFARFTLAWTGIGTGCLEPLMYELLVNAANSRANKPTTEIRRIILVGTAGAFRASEVRLGQVYLLNEAFLGASAISVPDHELTSAQAKPLQPHLELPCPQPLDKISPASIISTDYYYGFSKRANSSVLRQTDPRLGSVVDYAWGRVDMVDMETAQFYYLCKSLGPPALRYAALKGPADYVEGGNSGNVPVLVGS